MATMTLGEFERRYGKNKGSVQKQAQAMGLETRDGLDDVAVDKLLSYYKLGSYAPKETAQRRAATDLVVVEGSAEGLPTPGLQAYTMHVPAALANSFADPLAIAQQYLEFGEQVLEHLSEQTEALRKRAEDTRIAKQLVKDQTRRIAAAQRSAEIHAAVNTAFLQRDTAELQQEARVQ